MIGRIGAWVATAFLALNALLAVGYNYHRPTGTGTAAGPVVADVSSIFYVPASNVFLAIRQNTANVYVIDATDMSVDASRVIDCGTDLESGIMVDPYNERGFGNVVMIHDESAHTVCEYTASGLIDGTGLAFANRWDVDGILDTVDANNEGILFIPGDPNCTSSKHGGCFVYNLAQNSRTLERFQIDGSNVLTKIGTSFTLDALCGGAAGDVADLQYDFVRGQVYEIDDASGEICVLNAAMTQRVSLYSAGGPVSGDASADYEGMTWGAAKVVFADDSGATNGGTPYWTDAYCGDGKTSDTSETNCRGPSPEWKDLRWKNRRKIVIDVDQISGTTDFTDYQALVQFSADSGIKTMLSTCADTRFTTSDGLTLLDHDLVQCDATNGNFAAYVRIPTLEAETADTTLYLYYGNSGASTNEAEDATWPAPWVRVYHFEDTLSDGAADSSGNSGTATVVGTAPSSSTGKTGSAADFAARADSLDTAWGDSTAAKYTAMMGWFKIDSDACADATYSHVWAHGVSGNNTRFYFRKLNAVNGGLSQRVEGVANNPASPTACDANWHWAMQVLDSGDSDNARVYLDPTTTTPYTDDGNAHTAFSYTANSFHMGNIGGSEGTGEGLKGEMDEVFIWYATSGTPSSVPTADYALTRFRNQNNPAVGGFLTSTTDEVRPRRHVN